MQEMYDLAKPYITSWHIAIDGGAHHGAFSEVVVPDFKEVHAFEPHPENFEVAVEVKGVRAFYKSALSNRVGEGLLAPGNPPDRTSRFWLNEGPNGMLVAVTTIDHQNFKDVGIIKLDLEGHELYALQGGEETIERDRPVIIVEERRFGQKRYGLPKKAVGDWLMAHGYKRVASVRKDYVWVPE